MKRVERIGYRNQTEISAALSQQAAAEALWLSRIGSGKGQAMTREERERRIREVAYFRAQRRGFEPGFEEEDWLIAEREVNGAPRALH